jgi:GDP-L-fucose synthase
MYTKKKILVLGATGFLGKALLSFLDKKKYNVFLASKSMGFDFRYERVFKKIFNKNYDYIINCAAHVGGLKYLERYPADIFEDNTRIYLNLYKSLRSLRLNTKVINIISNCVYPYLQKYQKEKNIFNGEIHESVEPFGYSKLFLMKISNFYYKQYSIRSLNLISPNIFGPGDHLDVTRSHALNGIIVRMLEAQKNLQKRFIIWGSGKPKREWIFVEDVAKLIVKSIDDKNTKLFKGFNYINLAQNKSYSINQIARIVKKLINYKCHISHNLKYPDGAKIKQLDNKNFKKNYSNFNFINFEKAILKTIKYYKSKI